MSIVMSIAGGVLDNENITTGAGVRVGRPGAV